jgi:hypothetical protein
VTAPFKNSTEAQNGNRGPCAKDKSARLWEAGCKFVGTLDFGAILILACLEFRQTQKSRLSVGSLRGEGQPHTFREARVNCWGREVIAALLACCLICSFTLEPACRENQADIGRAAQRKNHIAETTITISSNRNTGAILETFEYQCDPVLHGESHSVFE